MNPDFIRVVCCNGENYVAHSKKGDKYKCLICGKMIREVDLDLEKIATIKSNGGVNEI